MSIWGLAQKRYYKSLLSCEGIYDCSGLKKDKEILDIILRDGITDVGITNYITIQYKEICFSKVKFYVFCTELQTRKTRNLPNMREWFVIIDVIIVNIESFEFLEVTITVPMYPNVELSLVPNRNLYMGLIFYNTRYTHTCRHESDHCLEYVRKYIRRELNDLIKLHLFGNQNSVILSFLKRSNILISYNLITILQCINKKRSHVLEIMKENCKCDANFNIYLNCKCQYSLNKIYSVVPDTLDIDIEM